ncbi:hypothetical protein J6590_009127 [Homalodisca vitripennis]|nr:hypothetical protein J6590_009127 [Homalodisca vitripennis]
MVVCRATRERKFARDDKDNRDSICPEEGEKRQHTALAIPHHGPRLSNRLGNKCGLNNSEHSLNKEEKDLERDQLTVVHLINGGTKTGQPLEPAISVDRWRVSGRVDRINPSVTRSNRASRQYCYLKFRLVKVSETMARLFAVVGSFNKAAHDSQNSSGEIQSHNSKPCRAVTLGAQRVATRVCTLATNQPLELQPNLALTYDLQTITPSL